MSRYLVTGGTGSFGSALVRDLLKDSTTERVVIFSRDEDKQRVLASELGDDPRDRLRFFLGDVRDLQRLRRAMKGCDTVVHAAALKQVPALEYNPDEAVKTNVWGTANVREAALDAPGVKRVVLVSTDKACSPSTLYGATKAVAEKLVVHGNAYSGSDGPRFSCVRYGNVFASRGSVIHVWRKQANEGAKLTITDPRMTRFWFTLPGAVGFVRDVLSQMKGGEVWVPRLPSFNIDDMRQAVAPLAGWESIGIRPTEKLHESMVSEDEAPLTWDTSTYYAICPPPDGPLGDRIPDGARPVPDGFVYRSDLNDHWLDVDALRVRVAPFVGAKEAA